MQPLKYFYLNGLGTVFFEKSSSAYPVCSCSHRWDKQNPAGSVMSVCWFSQQTYSRSAETNVFLILPACCRPAHNPVQCFCIMYQRDSSFCANTAEPVGVFMCIVVNTHRCYFLAPMLNMFQSLQLGDKDNCFSMFVSKWFDIMWTLDVLVSS